MSNVFRSSLIVCLFFITLLASAQDIIKKPFTIGESITFSSLVLEEERRLNIFIPSSYYDNSNNYYPVIYLLDGSIDEDFIHISGLIQFLSLPWINTVPESIVVGISNVDRKRDFTFKSNNPQDIEMLPTSGRSDQFIEFLNTEVKTIVNSNYRAKGETTIIGQSLGGLLATEILLKYPDSYDNYIIVSPSLWWDDQSLLKHDPNGIKPPKKIFVALGQEGPLMEGSTLKLIAKLQTLRKRELENSLIIDYELLSDLNHGNILHQAVYKALLNFKERANDSVTN